MAINFPDSPSLNAVFSSGGVDWKWDGTTWKGVAGTLPTASATVLGGVKVGTNLSIASGVLSASGGEITVQEEGSSLSTAATTLNFTGAGATASGTGAVKTINIPGSTSTTINNNADNRIITGSASTNTLNAESGFQCDGNALFLSDDKAIKFGSNLRMEVYTDGSINYIKSASDGSSPGAFPISIHSGPSEVINIDDGNTQIKTGLKDKDGDLGTAGQILSSTGTQVDWINAPPTFARAQAIATTASLAPETAANLDLPNVAKAYALYSIGTDQPAWVTLYTSQAARTADANRAMTMDPVPGSGVIAEIITGGNYTQWVSPMLMGYNNEATPVSTVYAKVHNKKTTAVAVQITLTYLALEV